MSVFFVSFTTSLTPTQLAGRRQALAAALEWKKLKLQTIPKGEGKTVVQRLAGEARGAPVIVLDDEHPEPDLSPWMRQLVKQTSDLLPSRKPQVVYVTAKTTASGTAQFLEHPLLKDYLPRDEKGNWVKLAAASAAAIVRQMREISEPPIDIDANDDGLIGESACFREAVEQLGLIVRQPYGIISGEAGVGKMFLIQWWWQTVAHGAPLVVLPCGVFFKDYYVGTSRRRFGGGREAVDQLTAYLRAASNGLLVLNHVERLPTALQEELVARLAVPRPGAMKHPTVGVDSQGLAAIDVRILATSHYAPDELRSRGLIDELATKLAKRHVRVPSLAQRGPDDVELVCKNILRRMVRRAAGDNGDWKKLVPPFGTAAMQCLRNASCPNNISDLLRWVEYAWRHCRGGTIQRAHLPADAGVPSSRPTGSLDEALAETTRITIRRALDQTGGDMKLAAKILGRSEKGLYRLVDQMGMKESGKDS
jgi:DNA-binding NtrC family response regulator